MSGQTEGLGLSRNILYTYMHIVIEHVCMHSTVCVNVHGEFEHVHLHQGTPKLDTNIIKMVNSI